MKKNREEKEEERTIEERKYHQRYDIKISEFYIFIPSLSLAYFAKTNKFYIK